jgi:hypothetical protein
LGIASIPSSFKSARDSDAASRTMSNVAVPNGSRSIRSSSATSSASTTDGHTCSPRQPRLTAQTTCAMSSTTRAFEVVPFGVETTAVRSHSGAFFGTRFWKNDGPVAPCGWRCIRTGRPAIARISGSWIAR